MKLDEKEIPIYLAETWTEKEYIVEIKLKKNNQCILRCTQGFDLSAKQKYSDYIKRNTRTMLAKHFLEMIELKNSTIEQELPSQR